MRNRVRGQDEDPLRCRRCRLHLDLCVCDLLVPLPASTKLLVVAHWAEIRKPTNTGQLAVHCLQDARLCVRGREDVPNDPIAWDSSTTPLVLFPTQDAMSLETWRSQHEEPVTLIVPEGTWRQAKRIPRRVPELAGVETVVLSPAQGSDYRLRHGHGEHWLATMEAVARALGILEGPERGPRIEERLMHVFRAAVDRALWSNGRLAASEVTGGIPPGARQG
jgi:DTW domain-containing protein